MLFKQFKVILSEPVNNMTVGNKYTVITVIGWSEYVVSTDVIGETASVKKEQVRLQTPEEIETEKLVEAKKKEQVIN